MKNNLLNKIGLPESAALSKAEQKNIMGKGWVETSFACMMDAECIQDDHIFEMCFPNAIGEGRCFRWVE